jgi:O-antigen/teichoic acid export membrane protein
LQEYHQFARRIGLIGATNLLISLSGLILLPILTKTLPIEDYGTYVQITVTIGLFPGIVMLGLPYTMVRFLAAAKSREEIQEGYYSIAGITILSAGLASVILFLLAGPLAAALFDGRTTVTEILALTVFLECINLLQYNYFRTFQQIKRYSSLLFLKTCLQLVLVGALVLAGYGIFGATVGLLAANLLLFLVMGVLIVSEIGITVPKFRHLREYLSFGIPTVPGNISSWVVNSSDRYMITWFMGAAYVGYYSPGYTLGYIINMLFTPLAFMLPATLSKYYDESNIETVRTVLSYSKKYFLTLAIPSVVGLSLLSKPLLVILTTPEIAEHGYLITLFASLGTLFYGVRSIDSQILILEKKTMITGQIWLLTGFLNIVLNFYFIPAFGILGAAVTTLATYVMAYLILGYISRKYLILPKDHQFVGKCFLASTIMAAILLYLNPVELYEILMTLIVCIIVYTGTLLALKGFTPNEIDVFKKIFSSYRNKV